MIGHFTYPFKCWPEWGWKARVERLDGRPNTMRDSKVIIDYFRNEQEALKLYAEWLNDLPPASK